MSRVFFINRFFAPDHSATAQLLTDLARELVVRGHETHIITTAGLYENPRVQLASEEIIDGIHVHRVECGRVSRKNLFWRGLSYLKIYSLFAAKIRELVRPGDVVVAKTDPPLLSVVAGYAGRRKGAILINWLQDLYPEIAVELGVPFTRGPVSGVLSMMRDHSLKHAFMNVVLGSRMLEQLQTCNIRNEQMTIIHNWSDDENIVPVRHEDNPLRKAWGLEGKFVIAYSGNLGRAHEYETLLLAAQLLSGRSDFIFLFIGGGHHVRALKSSAEELGLGHLFQFRPYQEKELLKYSLNVGDVHWLSLRPEMEGLIVPSKLYGIAAAGRPVIAVSASDGEVGRLVRYYQCGLQVTPDEGGEFASAILRFASDLEFTAETGKSARAMIDAKFNRRGAFDLWDKLIRSSTTDRP